MSESTQIASDEQLLDLANAYEGDDTDRGVAFLRAAFEQAGLMLGANRKEAPGFMNVEEDPDPEEVLDPENIVEIEVRARPLECPRVTFWMREKNLPSWANTADRRTFKPYGLNAYNGEVTAVIDVRPF